MKRIIVCADGTWSIRDQHDKKSGKIRPTNVTKIARAILPQAKDDISQVLYYHNGIGTNGGIDKYTAGAFGRGVEGNIRDLYRFIAYNYVEGDEIFLFGFSRGAFTVRSLAGFMHYAGLLEKDDDYYVPEIYRCYQKRYKKGSREWDHAFRNIDGTRKSPPIKFIGVWDTVGSLGAPGVLGRVFKKNKYRYHDVGLNAEIENVVHALAIDEKRKSFAPDVYTIPAGWNGSLVQAWFPGAHTNVGGGVWPDGLANEALHWVVGMAENQGLEVDSDYLKHFEPCFNSAILDSVSIGYKLIGLFTRIPGRSGKSEVLHKSIIDRMNFLPAHYKPENLKNDLGKKLKDRVVDTVRIKRGEPCAGIK